MLISFSFDFEVLFYFIEFLLIFTAIIIGVKLILNFDLIGYTNMSLIPCQTDFSLKQVSPFISYSKLLVVPTNSPE